jgi:DNA-binding MarR family transcriptional regulator
METYKIPMTLRAAYLSMHRQTNAHLAQSGVTADQFVCLLILMEEDGIIQQELVKRASSDPNTMRAMLVILEKHGFITRKSHPEDGRARIVNITKKGRQIFNELVNSLKPVRDRLSSLFSDKEAEFLNKFLGMISEVMFK